MQRAFWFFYRYRVKLGEFSGMNIVNLIEHILDVCGAHVSPEVSWWRGQIVLWIQGMQEESTMRTANRSAQIFWGKQCCICLVRLAGCSFAFLCQGSIPYALPFTGCCVQGVLACQDIWFFRDLYFPGTFLLFWECTGLSWNAGCLPRSSTSCVCQTQSQGIVLKMQNAGMSLCSVPCAPRFYFFGYLLKFCLFFSFLQLLRFLRDLGLNGKSVLDRQKTFFSGVQRIRSAARTPASRTARRTCSWNTTAMALEQKGTRNWTAA